MMTVGVPVEANKALIRRFIEEVHNKGNFALFNELFAPNYVNHSAPANQNDRAAREQGIRSYRAAAQDLRVTIDDMIAEGDKVALRWTTHGTERGPLRTPLGIAPPTDRPISIPGGQYLPHHQRADRGRMDRLGYAKLGATARVPDAAITSVQRSATVTASEYLCRRRQVIGRVVVDWSIAS